MFIKKHNYIKYRPYSNRIFISFKEKSYDFSNMKAFFKKNKSPFKIFIESFTREG